MYIVKIYFFLIILLYRNILYRMFLELIIFPRCMRERRIHRVIFISEMPQTFTPIYLYEFSIFLLRTSNCELNAKPSNLRDSHSPSRRVTIRLHERLTFCHNNRARVSVLAQLMPSLLRFRRRLLSSPFSRSRSPSRDESRIAPGTKGNRLVVKCQPVKRSHSSYSKEKYESGVEERPEGSHNFIVGSQRRDSPIATM